MNTFKSLTSLATSSRKEMLRLSKTHSKTILTLSRLMSETTSWTMIQ